jgi:polysaccharide chain length determinant protein (PEP-CTERM system associated)
MLPGRKYSLDDIVRILRRRAWLLALPPVIGLFATLVVSAQLPNLYQSDMLIAIVPQRVPDSFVRSTVTLRTEERLDAISTQVQSRTLIEQMIRELDLYKEERERLPMEDVVQLMRSNIEVQPEAPRRGPRGPEPLHAFHVRFTYTDPNIAAQITQRLGSLFVDQNARDRGALAEATNQFLEAQLAEARERLEATESRLETFRELHGSELPTQMQSNLQVMQSTQLQIQALVESIARDRDRKLMLERLYNEAQSEPALAAPAAPQQQASAQPDPATGTAGTPEQQLAAARSALARLELRLTPEHPDIQRGRRVVRDLEAQVKASQAASAEGAAPAPVTVSIEEQQRRERLRAMRAEIESLDRQTQFKESEETRLRGVVSEYQRRIEAVPGVESEWVALSRDYETQQNAYKELLGKSEQSKVAVDLERRQIGEQFRILDPAGVPVRPISPIRIKINAIGLAIGLMLGLGIAAFFELKDSSFRTESDVVDVLSLPVLALVPYVETAAERASRTRMRTFVSAAGVASMGVAAYLFWAMRLWNFLV